jgi:hypothetical protein
MFRASFSTISSGLLLGGLLLLGSGAPASAQVLVNFDDNPGSTGAVDTMYSSLGVTFSNARFYTHAFVLPGGPSASNPNLIASWTDFVKVPELNPIVASFSVDVNSVSIKALHVGANGARLRAYDENDNFLIEDSFTGPVGDGALKTLTVNVANIRKVRFSQIDYQIDGNDGIAWDDFAFTRQDGLTREALSAPEPMSMALMAPGLAVLGFLKRRRRRNEEDA